MTKSNQRKVAKELLQAAHKVYHYRRDVTSEAHLAELDDLVGNLDQLIRDKEASAESLETAMTSLDSLLRKIGGKIYPKTFWNDNIEVALVAAIIVIGIRTFFFQPFIIPTNSMYPTYSGMNGVIYADSEPDPGVLERGFRFLTLGARHKSLTAMNGGRVQVPLVMTANGPQVQAKRVKGRKFFVLPSVLSEYTILVDGVPHLIRVPAEFDMRSTMLKAFSDFKPSLSRAQNGSGYVWDFGKSVKAGDPLVRFDITLGDALFVDRISYHFKSPKPGDSFVFRTGEIPGIEGSQNDVVDKYYIKRIGGAEGETLEITPEGALLVDGEPRDEVEAFGRNARKDGEYGGYVYPAGSASLNSAAILTGPGIQDTVPEGKFVALGDNSANSLDSRYWGYVPEKSVIGKAIFIYYPFTKRWGIAE